MLIPKHVTVLDSSAVYHGTGITLHGLTQHVRPCACIHMYHHNCNSPCVTQMAFELNQRSSVARHYVHVPELFQALAAAAGTEPA